jgi:hypothetical protein
LDVVGGVVGGHVWGSGFVVVMPFVLFNLPEGGFFIVVSFIFEDGVGRHHLFVGSGKFAAKCGSGVS